MPKQIIDLSNTIANLKIEEKVAANCFVPEKSRTGGYVLYVTDPSPLIKLTDAVTQIKDAARQAVEEATRWIPVTERLPEDDGTVMVCAPSADPNKPFYFTAFFMKNERIFSAPIVKVWIDAIQYWQPIQPYVQEVEKP